MYFFFTGPKKSGVDHYWPSDIGEYSFYIFAQMIVLYSKDFKIIQKRIIIVRNLLCHNICTWSDYILMERLTID